MGAHMTFKTLSLLTAALTFCLCLGLLFAPGLFFWLFGVEGNDLGAFMGKRAGMLFLGLCAMTYLGRNAPASQMRGSVAMGITLAMTGLAGIGLYEFFRGYAGIGIWLAIVTELVLASAWFSVARGDLRQTP